MLLLLLQSRNIKSESTHKCSGRGGYLVIWSFWLIIFRLLGTEILKKYLLKILSEKKIAEIVQCWQTLNKTYDKSDFAMMGSKLNLPMQKWDTRQNSPFGKYQRHYILLWRIQVSNGKQKTWIWFIQNPKLKFIYPNNIGNTQVPFLLTCFCSASIVLILEVYCSCILSLLFPSSHANDTNIVTILLVCLSTAPMGYCSDLPFLDYGLSHGSHSARACTMSSAVIFEKLP